MPATYTRLVYHIVFATKGRVPVLTANVRQRVHEYIGGTVKGLNGVALAVGGTEDHVHVVVSLSATHCLADFVRELKKAASHWIRSEIGMQSFAWQEGYGAFTVSNDVVPTAVAYVNDQEAHHRTEGSQAELLRLLRELGVEVDMRFFE
jgi:REP element-mobilizing transposase RayT